MKHCGDSGQTKNTQGHDNDVSGENVRCGRNLCSLALKEVPGFDLYLLHIIDAAWS